MRRALIVTLVVLGTAATVASVAAAVAKVRNTGNITLLAPCDDTPLNNLPQGVLEAIKSDLKLDEASLIFATAGTVTCDTDRSVFILSIRVEKDGAVVARGSSTASLNKGQSTTLVAYTGSPNLAGTYTLYSILDVVVDGAMQSLDSKNCKYTVR